jgi:hypothetical protein
MLERKSREQDEETGKVENRIQELQELQECSLILSNASLSENLCVGHA